MNDYQMSFHRPRTIPPPVDAVCRQRYATIMHHAAIKHNIRIVLPSPVAKRFTCRFYAIAEAHYGAKVIFFPRDGDGMHTAESRHHICHR